MKVRSVTHSVLCLAALASALPQGKPDASLMQSGKNSIGGSLHNTHSLTSLGSGEGAVTEQNQPAWYQRNFKTIQAIYDMTVYPANAAVITQGGKAVPPGLFAQDVIGRVSPVGNFTGFEDSIEYFFALAPTPQGNMAHTAFYEAEIVDFVSGCPSVASSLVYFRSGTVSEAGVLDKTKPMTTLSQVRDLNQ